MVASESTSIWPTCATSPPSAAAEVQPSVVLKAAEAESRGDALHRPCKHNKTLPRHLFDAPEAKSIHAILREHCRSRLYLPPVFWTAEQVKLLGCEFVSKELPRNERRKTPIPTGLQESGDATAVVEKTGVKYDYTALAATRLCEPCPLEATTSAVRDILTACNIEYLGAHTPLSFHFDRRVINVHTDGIFASKSAIPSLAYVNLETLRSLRFRFVRQKYLSRTARRRANTPVARLIQKKLASLVPEREAEDPYMVAVLIALAQQQHREQQQLRHDTVGATHDEAATAQSTAGTTMAVPSGEQETSFKVHLLVIPGIAAPQVHLYTARIPLGFLDKFDRPSKFSPSGPISIVYYTIPLRNAERLPKRLRRALRAPVE